MKNPKLIATNGPENHWSYYVPTYKVENDGIKDGEEIIIDLCRGDSQDETAPRQQGVFTETLLQLCVQYLTSVNKGDLANRDTSIAITHIEDALLRLGKRAEDRKLREVQGTYQK